MKSIKYTLTIILLGILFIFCERKEPLDLSEFNCSECYQEKPEWGSILVHVTIDDENPRVPLVVYFGNFEDGNIDWYDTADTKEYYIEVRSDYYYSVTAEYKKGEKTIYAVDGDKIKLKYSSEDCDVPCYYFKGGYFDLKLRD